MMHRISPRMHARAASGALLMVRIGSNIDCAGAGDEQQT